MLEQLMQFVNQFGWQVTVFLLLSFSISQISYGIAQYRVTKKTESNTIQGMVTNLTSSYNELMIKYENLRLEMSEMVNGKIEDDKRIANLFWDIIIWGGIAAGGWLFGYLVCITWNIGSFAR